MKKEKIVPNVPKISALEQIDETILFLENKINNSDVKQTSKIDTEINKAPP